MFTNAQRIKIEGFHPKSDVPHHPQYPSLALMRDGLRREPIGVFVCRKGEAYAIFSCEQVESIEHGPLQLQTALVLFGPRVVGE
jgi:hypothetical protein